MKAPATILLAIAAALLPGSGRAEQATDASAAASPAIITAPATPRSTVSDPSAKLSQPTREVLKLVVAGVPEAVVKAYIQNSTSGFNLTTDNIIHLQGVGVSGGLMADMLTHDKALKDSTAAYAATAAAQAPPMVAPAPVYQPPAQISYPPPAPNYQPYYEPVSYVGYDYPASYPYYPWYGYSYFPSLSFSFGGYGRRFDRDDRFGRGGFNRGGIVVGARSFGGGVRGGFSSGVVRTGGSIGGSRGGSIGGHR